VAVSVPKFQPILKNSCRTVGAGVEVTSPQFYSAGHTGDLRTALFYLALKYPKARMLGLGFSLGASVVTRYLGEEGANSKLASGCVLACVRIIPPCLSHEINQNI